MAALDPNAAHSALATAMPGATSVPPVPSAAAESAVAANLIRAVPPTRVLVLLNMVSEAELSDQQEYEVSCDSQMLFLWVSRLEGETILVCSR